MTDCSTVDEIIKKFNSSSKMIETNQRKAKINGLKELKKELDKDKKEPIYELDKNILNNLDNELTNELTNELSSELDNSINQSHILYVLVVGFHHKKGCQIDYCYPQMKLSNQNLEDNNFSPTHQLPSIWKTLPSLGNVFYT